MHCSAGRIAMALAMHLAAMGASSQHEDRGLAHLRTATAGMRKLQALPVTRYMNNTNFPADNLPGGGCNPVVPSKFTTALGCQRACDNNPPCDMWTFVPAMSPGNPSQAPWCCQKTCGRVPKHQHNGTFSTGGRRHGGCELPNAQEGVVSGAKTPSDWLPPRCTSDYCFRFSPDWSSGSPESTLPVHNFSIRKLEAVHYPPDGRVYAFADVINFTDYWFPDSYSSEIGVFSSDDGRTKWTYHGIVIHRGPAGNWDGGGVASPGVAVCENGSVLLGYAAESSSNGHFGTRGIGVASAAHPLGPFEKHDQPVASPFTTAGVCSQTASGAKGWVACDDVVMETRPGGEVHLYHSVKGGAAPPGPGIRHHVSTDCGLTWGNSSLVLSTTLQPGTYPAETIAGRYFPGVLGGKGGMVLITDGGPSFALHAYLSKAPGDMVNFVPADEIQLYDTERPANGWANLQLEFIPLPNKSNGSQTFAVACAMYTNQSVFSEQHNRSMYGYTHTVFQLDDQPH